MITLHNKINSSLLYPHTVEKEKKLEIIFNLRRIPHMG